MMRHWLVTGLLLSGCIVRAHLGDSRPVAHWGPLSGFPRTLSAWTGEDAPLPAEVVSGAGVDDYLNRYYRSHTTTVGLYVAYYSSQQPGRAIHSPMNCLPAAGWQPIKADRIDLSLKLANVSRSVNKVVIEKGLEQNLVLYWYQTANRVTASEYWSKAFLVADAFRTGRTDVALVRIIAPIDSDDSDGEAKALNVAVPFAEHVLPVLRNRIF